MPDSKRIEQNLLNSATLKLMNNRFKFRAWSQRDKCWCGAFAIHKSGLFSEIINAKLINGVCVANPHWKELTDDSDIILMQFTGFYDKKSEELWEGDIIEINHKNYQGVERAEIRWDGDRWWAKSLKYPHRSDGVDACIWEKWKKVGNIYNNPELIKSP